MVLTHLFSKFLLKVSCNLAPDENSVHVGIGKFLVCETQVSHIFIVSYNPLSTAFFSSESFLLKWEGCSGFSSLISFVSKKVTPPPLVVYFLSHSLFYFLFLFFLAFFPVTFFSLFLFLSLFLLDTLCVCICIICSINFQVYIFSFHLLSLSSRGSPAMSVSHHNS